MTFSDAIGVESPTLFGVYFVLGCLWALCTGIAALMLHLIDDGYNEWEGAAARTAARLFFQTPIWPAIAALWALKGLMALHGLAYSKPDQP